jgi:uncharacterized protein (TIGR03000 family)
MTSPLRPGRAALAAAALVVLSGLLLARQANDKKPDEKKPDAKEGPAKLVVILPANGADAKLSIDGNATRQVGRNREFVSPPLKPGKDYEYKIEAKWEPNNYEKVTRKRAVIVRAGETTEVDLRKHDPKTDDLVIRFVPTPAKVVDAMCKLGKVDRNDVVFDLGCGDGRIVIAAVEKFGASKGVGIDLDPKRIEECHARAGANSRLEFRVGDVFKVEDLDKASVVMLYMSDDLNEQLRPILEKKLKPGSRIVSHRFLMGDWKPEHTDRLTVDGEEYLVHLWTIKEKKNEEKDKDRKDKDKDKEKKDK